MFKVKLLFLVSIISGANLYAVKVKDLINCLTPERREQVEASGYDLINSKFAAVRFVIEQFPLLSREHMRDLREYVGQLFADGRQVVNESDIYDVIDKFAEDKKIEVLRPGMDSSSLDVAAPGAAAASMITFSLTKCMSEEEADRVKDQGGYYPDQLNEALRRFLEKNGASLSEGKIRAIKKEFNDRYFKGATSGKHIAPVGAVDADFTRLVDDIKLSIGSIAIPEIKYCPICATDIEEGAVCARCINEHSFHKDCIEPHLAANPDSCPTCRCSFVIKLGDWFKYVTDGSFRLVKRCIEEGVNINIVNSLGDTALAIAASKGHKKIIEELLRVGANVNLADNNGNTALMRASMRGHKEIVKILLDAGADVSVTSGEGAVALMYAAIRGDEEVVKMLLDAGADVNFAGKDDMTTLALVAYAGCKEVVKILLDAGANVNFANKDGATALALAACKGHGEVVELLLGAGANFGAGELRVNQALIEAIKVGKFEIAELLIRAGASREAALEHFTVLGNAGAIEFLIKNGANVNIANSNGRVPLIVMAYKRNIEIATLLVGGGANLSADVHGYTALINAIAEREFEIAKLLIRAGANPEVALNHFLFIGKIEAVRFLISVDRCGDTALIEAITNKKIENAKLLIRAGANTEAALKHFMSIGKIEAVRFLISVDRCGDMALIEAITNKKIENAKLLIRAGANREFALMHFASIGDVETAEFLVEKGANVNAVDSDGKTALMAAIEKRHLYVVKFLIAKGADRKAALMRFAWSGAVEALRYLIDLNIDINATDSNGNTALMVAVVKKYVDVVRLLIDEFANLDAINSDGETALSLAIADENTEVVELLRANGAGQ